MSNLRNLSQIFDNKLFKIPDYQRGYAWDVNQLEDLWDDLISLPVNSYHYTGQLTLKKTDSQYDSTIDKETFEVIDGQQRLTSFIILINELVSFIETNDNIADKKINNNKISDIKSKYLYKIVGIKTIYVLSSSFDSNINNFFANKILNQDANIAIDENYYTTHLLNAKRFFKENIENIVREQGIEVINLIFNNLTSSFMFNVFEIDEKYNRYMAFETMNNRGKKLSTLEILKNRLLYLSTILNTDEINKIELQKNINNAWKEIYKQIGRNPNKQLVDDDYLLDH